METRTLALTAFIALFALSTASARAEGEPTPAPGYTEVEIPLESVLAPSEGFDDNDNIQVVLRGSLPNGCYSLSRSELTRTADPHRINVKQFALKRTAGICGDVAHLPDSLKLSVPFVTEASIGRLDKGKYEFDFQGENHVAGVRPLSVAAATAPTVDNLPYALVTSVAIGDVVSTTDELVVTLSGLLNSTCSSVDPNVKVLKENDVYVLLPVIKVKNLALCTQLREPFSLQVKLGKAAAGQYLIHTRSMNGKAVNKVVDVINR